MRKWHGSCAVACSLPPNDRPCESWYEELEGSWLQAMPVYTELASWRGLS